MDLVDILVTRQPILKYLMDEWHLSCSSWWRIIGLQKMNKTNLNASCSGPGHFVLKSPQMPPFEVQDFKIFWGRAHSGIWLKLKYNDEGGRGYSPWPCLYLSSEIVKVWAKVDSWPLWEGPHKWPVVWRPTSGLDPRLRGTTGAVKRHPATFSHSVSLSAQERRVE